MIPDHERGRIFLKHSLGILPRQFKRVTVVIFFREQNTHQSGGAEAFPGKSDHRTIEMLYLFFGKKQDAPREKPCPDRKVGKKKIIILMKEIFQRGHRCRVDLPPLESLVDLGWIRFEKTYLRLYSLRPKHFYKAEVERETVEIADFSDTKFHMSHHKIPPC